MGTMQLADDGEGMRCAFAGGVFVSFIYAAPTLARMNFLFEHESRWTSSLQHFSAISIVDPRVGREMTAEARARQRNYGGHARQDDRVVHRH